MVSITETLRSLEAASDDDAAFIIAATINLYSESIRRRAGRIIYGPGDVKRLLSMCATLLAPAELAEQSYSRTTARQAEPSETEREMISDITKLAAIAR